MKRYSSFNGEVEAAPIAGFDFDSEHTERYVVFDDGTKEIRPRVHGYNPQIGDYFVRALSPGTTHIVGRKVFAAYYTPLE